MLKRAPNKFFVPSLVLFISVFELMLFGCVQAPKSRGLASVAPVSFTAAQKQWQNALAQHLGYEMAYKIECTCDLMPIVTVKVDGHGKVLKIAAEPPESAPEKSDAMTIEKLFKIIKNNKGKSSNGIAGKSLQARFNPSTGAPDYVSIDQDPSLNDDDERIIILKLKFD